MRQTSNAVAAAKLTGYRLTHNPSVQRMRRKRRPADLLR